MSMVITVVMTMLMIDSNHDNDVTSLQPITSFHVFEYFATTAIDISIGKRIDTTEGTGNEDESSKSADDPEGSNSREFS